MLTREQRSLTAHYNTLTINILDRITSQLPSHSRHKKKQNQN